MQRLPPVYRRSQLRCKSVQKRGLMRKREGDGNGEGNGDGKARLRCSPTSLAESTIEVFHATSAELHITHVSEQRDYHGA